MPVGNAQEWPHEHAELSKAEAGAVIRMHAMGKVVDLLERQVLAQRLDSGAELLHIQKAVAIAIEIGKDIAQLRLSNKNSTSKRLIKTTQNASTNREIYLLPQHHHGEELLERQSAIAVGICHSRPVAHKRVTRSRVRKQGRFIV